MDGEVCIDLLHDELGAEPGIDRFRALDGHGGGLHGGRGAFGKAVKYSFYVFDPLHMLILGLIAIA